MSAAAERPDPVRDERIGTDHPTHPDPSLGRQARSTPLLPETLADGRYRVTDRLGVGGMGVVMRARDEVLGRDVAVKMLADNLSMDDSSRARFLQEARAAAAVTDPRVVAVFDVGEEGGRPYLVMELVDGPSLAAVLAAEGPLSGEEVLDIAIDALAGLGCAHEAGLLHRDVKPGNLLRAPDGTVKVTDFGVAVAVDSDRLTRTGHVIGTAAYLPPERRRGEGATVRTDLWSLGATLTELLTGEPPGAAADAALAARGDEVPARLRLLLRRLLAADARDRPRDALEALELLAGDAAASHAATPPAGSGTIQLMPTADASSTPTPHGTAAPAGASPSSTVGPRTSDSVAGGDGRQRSSRRPRLFLVVAVVILAALAATTVVSDFWGATADEAFGPITVDPDDPAGTARDLAEQLRDRAGR